MYECTCKNIEGGKLHEAECGVWKRFDDEKLAVNAGIIEVTRRPEPVVLNPAVKLEPGGIYVVEYDRLMSRTESDNVIAALKERGDELGVKFILLHSGLKIARSPIHASQPDDARGFGDSIGTLDCV